MRHVASGAPHFSKPLRRAFRSLLVATLAFSTPAIAGEEWDRPLSEDPSQWTLQQAYDIAENNYGECIKVFPGATEEDTRLSCAMYYSR